MRRLVRWILAGSLLRLLATIPSHFIVRRRPGCFVGLLTFGGLMAGLYVMTWAFGPGIALLFWSEIRQRTRGHCPACGYYLRGLSEMRCPDCGRPFTFHEVQGWTRQSRRLAKPAQLAGTDGARGTMIDARWPMHERRHPSGCHGGHMVSRSAYPNRPPGSAGRPRRRYRHRSSRRRGCSPAGPGAGPSSTPSTAGRTRRRDHCC
jgi:hypothetical protein